MPFRLRSRAPWGAGLCLLLGFVFGPRGSDGDAPALRPSPVAEARLQVRIEGLRGDRGQVGVLLFVPEGRKGFPHQVALSFRQAFVAPRGGGAVHVFEALVPGVYAVSIVHDENQSGGMDRNLLGMPQEGFGFSRDPSTRVGAPGFEQARFELGPGQTELRIQVRYP